MGRVGARRKDRERERNGNAGGARSRRLGGLITFTGEFQLSLEDLEWNFIIISR